MLIDDLPLFVLAIFGCVEYYLIYINNLLLCLQSEKLIYRKKYEGATTNV